VQCNSRRHESLINCRCLKDDDKERMDDYSSCSKALQRKLFAASEGRILQFMKEKFAVEMATDDELRALLLTSSTHALKSLYDCRVAKQPVFLIKNFPDESFLCH